MEVDYEPVFDGVYESYQDHPINQNDRILAGLCYIFGWIVCLIVLIAVKPLSPFLRFHAIQALGLYIIYMILYMIMAIGMIILIGFFLLPVILGLMIYALVIGIIILTGRDHRVPWLGDYVEENFV